MHCPYCQQTLAEESVQCAGCGLQLTRLDAVLGIPLTIAAGLNDGGGLLSGSAARQVRNAIARFRERFPQIQLAVLFREAPSVVPLRTWAWWVFNRGNFSAALDVGFSNRDILLVLDPVRRQSALTIGYGLEPFVGNHDLAAALEAGQAALGEAQWADACGQILAALDDGLRRIVGRMPRTYGVPVPLLKDLAGTPEASPSW